jgi:hypothetical protein
MGANRFIFRRAQILSHHRRILYHCIKPAKLGIKHCMVKNIYNAKQNPPLIGAILIQQKSSTKTLKIAARKDLTNQRNQ